MDASNCRRRGGENMVYEKPMFSVEIPSKQVYSDVMHCLILC